MDKKNARIALYALAGVYLLANAYQMFQNLDNSVSSNERMLTIIFIIIFVIVGGIMVGVGIWNGNQGMKAYKEAYYKVPDEAEETQEIEEIQETEETVTKSYEYVQNNQKNEE